MIVTDGACGAYAAQAGKVSHLQGFPVHVVDTIGSGDAHAGGVLAGLASGDFGCVRHVFLKSEG